MSNLYNRQYFEDRDILAKHLAETIKSFLKENRLKSVLDVGCGTGRLVKFLNGHGFNAVGCDSSQGALKKARKINNKNLIFDYSATKLPFKSNSFDLVTTISVVEHLTPKEVGQFLNESKRVLTENGFIFLVTPNLASPARIIFGKKWFAYQDPTHINLFTPKRLAKILLKFGFKNITFSFAVPPNVQYDLHLPAQLRILPKPVRSLVNYLLFTSPLCLLRDSFWVAAQNNGK